MFTRTCPNCQSFAIRRSHRQGLYETMVQPLFFQRPYRCRFCHSRFYALVLRRRKLLDRGQPTPTVAPFFASSGARIFTMTLLAVMVPALLAVAAPAREYLRKAAATHWNYLLGMSDPPKRSVERSMRAGTGDAAFVAADCCSAIAPASLAVVTFSRGEKPLAAQQEAERKSVGSLQSSGSVFVNNAAVAGETTIFENDVVRTGADGVARLDVKNRGAISIFPNSRISFTANWRHFASLVEGKFSVLSFPAASRFQINIGYFVLTPSADEASGAEVDVAADGSAVVRATQGSIGVIALEGPTAIFLQPGQAARITTTGEAFPAKPGEVAVAQAQAPPPAGKQPEKKPAPESKPVPSVAKKKTNPIVWVALLGAGGAGAAIALGKKSSSSPAVSPSIP